MYLHQLELNQGVLTVTFHGLTPDSDFVSYADDVRRLVSQTPPNCRPLILVCDPSMLVLWTKTDNFPTAQQRRIISEATKDLPRTDGLFCLASESLIVRATLTVVHSIQKPEYAFNAVASLDDAKTWIASMRPQVIDRVEGMLRTMADALRSARDATAGGPRNGRR